MNLRDLAQTKAELLCYGVRLDDCAKDKCTYQNSYLLDGGFVHAAHFLFEGTVVNTCITETFCQDSPYVITCISDRFILEKDNKSLCDIQILQLPDWCTESVENYRIGDYFRPHSPDCISGCPILRCSYYDTSNQCRFCSLNAHATTNNLSIVLPINVVAEMINKALEYNPNYEVALSGGTFKTEDKSAKYFSDVCKILTNGRKEKLDISVELAPPDKDEYIDELYSSGVTALIMNIEIANDEIRRKICPGKSSIPLSRYYSALTKAVSVFGRGNVSSVLIAGIQPVTDIIGMCEILIPMGIVPTIIPFKPLDSCLMRNMPKANPQEVLMIAEIVNSLMQKEKLLACNQGGCTKCGGCSLESVFQLAY